MEIKKVLKTIEVELYVASDGEGFEDEDEAIVHEAEIKVKELFGIDEETVNSPNDVYITVKSEEEVNILHTFIYDSCSLSCNIKFDPYDINEPTLIRFDSDGNLRIVSQEEYVECKKLCNLYENIMKS